MRRIGFLVLLLALIYAVAWAANPGTAVNMHEFPGPIQKSGNWLYRTNTFILPGCWYDSTANFDTLRDTVCTPWVYLGSEDIEYLIIKHQLSQVDSFCNVDSIDSIFLTFEACADSTNLSSLRWTYAFAGSTGAQASPTTTVFTIADSLLYYQYPYVRYRMIYRCVADSFFFSWTANCAGKDLIGSHLPIVLTEYYYPIWK